MLSHLAPKKAESNDQKLVGAARHGCSQVVLNPLIPNIIVAQAMDGSQVYPCFPLICTGLVSVRSWWTQFIGCKLAPTPSLQPKMFGG